MALKAVRGDLTGFSFYLSNQLPDLSCSKLDPVSKFPEGSVETQFTALPLQVEF